MLSPPCMCVRLSVSYAITVLLYVIIVHVSAYVSVNRLNFIFEELLRMVWGNEPAVNTQVFTCPHAYM